MGTYIINVTKMPLEKELSEFRECESAGPFALPVNVKSVRIMQQILDEAGLENVRIKYDPKHRNLWKFHGVETGKENKKFLTGITKIEIFIGNGKHCGISHIAPGEIVVQLRYRSLRTDKIKHIFEFYIKKERDCTFSIYRIPPRAFGLFEAKEYLIKRMFYRE